MYVHNVSVTRAVNYWNFAEVPSSFIIHTYNGKRCNLQSNHRLIAILDSLDFSNSRTICRRGRKQFCMQSSRFHSLTSVYATKSARYLYLSRKIIIIQITNVFRKTRHKLQIYKTIKLDNITTDVITSQRDKRKFVNSSLLPFIIYVFWLDDD